MIKKILYALAILLLVGCGEEKKFMTPSSDVAIIDITSKEFFLNGEKVGDTFNEIEDEKRGQMIASLERKIKELSPSPKTAHIHIASKNSFKVLFKTLGTVNWSGLDSVKIALEDDFSSIIHAKLNEEINPCNGPRVINIHDLLMNKGLSADEKNNQKIQERNRDLECAENFMELAFFLNKTKDSFFISSSINETGLIGKKTTTSFKNETEIWAYFKEIRTRESLANKKDRNIVNFACSKDLSTEEFAPYLRGLANLGYQVKFSQMD
ncbi:MAG: hypothetical protein IK012_11445 [Fibrobacter sp.]|uniref:hypothetical protein n=1 Tax=Fibrobacter sp. TaxID=35828 RepID=UPI0025C35A03|nr:hypothetical protein [Fibrobacter sp.]MBR4785845.1 hypothetical protein [Fibrobacter sp.]